MISKQKKIAALRAKFRSQFCSSSSRPNVFRDEATVQQVEDFWLLEMGLLDKSGV